MAQYPLRWHSVFKFLFFVSFPGSVTDLGLDMCFCRSARTTNLGVGVGHCLQLAPMCFELTPTSVGVVLSCHRRCKRIQRHGWWESTTETFEVRNKSRTRPSLEATVDSLTPACGGVSQTAEVLLRVGHWSGFWPGRTEWKFLRFLRFLRCLWLNFLCRTSTTELGTCFPMTHEWSSTAPPYFAAQSPVCMRTPCWW